MKKRNDDAADIERVEWNVLLYGEEHFTNRFVTAGLAAGDHPRRTWSTSTAVLPPREHDRGGVGGVLAARR